MRLAVIVGVGVTALVVLVLVLAFALAPDGPDDPGGYVGQWTPGSLTQP